MEHKIVVERWEGARPEEDYNGYRYEICQIPVDQASETGWPDAIEKAKLVIKAQRIVDELQNVTDHVYKCYSKKTEPIAVEVN